MNSHSFARMLVRAGVAAAVLLLAPYASFGQVLPDIPIIYDFGVGARAMGMGQAHVAACEDASAIVYNPASLALIRRIEVSAGFSHLSQDFETSLFRSDMTSTLGSTKLSSLGLAYPFPTYRGSFVLGLAYNRIRNTDYDYIRFSPDMRYYLDSTYGFVTGAQKETIFERGGIASWTVALGTDVAPDVSIGGSVSFLSGSSERQSEWIGDWDIGSAQRRYQYSYLSNDADITGWTASFGTLARVGNFARIGFTVRLPEHLTVDGTQYIEEYDSLPDEFYYDEFAFEDEITLPVSFVGGISAAPIPGLILAFDARYTDWKQIDYAGPIRVDNFYAYKATTSLRLGAEYMLPSVPLRLRAGYFTEPLAYKLIPDVNGTGYQEASIDSDGKFYTLGAGYLLEDSFTIDAAWVHGGFERSVPDYSEKSTSDKLFVTVGYRF